ncbi:hypothetical protein D3C87_1528520 [compost metagenome]
MRTWHGIKPAAINLGDVAGVVHANADDPHLHGRHADPVVGQHVVEEIHLDQQRCAADEFDHPGDRPRQPVQAASSADGEEQPQHDGDQEADQGNAHGVERSAQQIGEDLPGVCPVEQGHDRPPRIRPRASRRSMLRMPRLIACARMKYITSARLKISNVWNVA